MAPIADSPYARDVALWVAGGDQIAFTAALAAHENASWTGGHNDRIDRIDRSLAEFDHQEYWIVRRLALQGHIVIALPTRHLAGLRSPDTAVSGLLVEFKTYTGLNPCQLLCRVGHARPQADRVVVGVVAHAVPPVIYVGTSLAVVHVWVELNNRASSRPGAAADSVAPQLHPRTIGHPGVVGSSLHVPSGWMSKESAKNRFTLTVSSTRVR